MKRTLTLLLTLATAGTAAAQGYVFNQAPLAPTFYAELPIGAIQPKGWLLDQLERQRDGLTGHLDELYPEVVGADNAWIGGEGDTWERGPYWIDGLLPLAYILGDEALIAKSKVWTEALITSARADGYFGNAVSRPYVEGLQRGKAEDWWPKMVAIKILKQYFMATGDTRALDVLTGYFRYQAAHLQETPLGHWSYWGRWRAADNIGVIYWLYNQTGESFLLDLAALIHSQAIDFTDLFHSGELFRTQNSAHCVNLAQGFKTPVVWWQQSGNEADLNAPKEALKAIRTTIGLPTGLWAGDELLHFGDPARGSELCTAVEMMFSLEEMLRITGDLSWADYLERVAYNALPTQATDAYDGRQYFQQTNQIACTYGRRNFITEHYGTDIVFGLLNGYPCCTCNMHQGWPKLTQNLWYATRDGGLSALVYAPSEVTATAGGVEVRLREETAYPFEGAVRITVDFPARKVRKASFPLRLRIPAWCTGAEVRVNDIPATEAVNGETICLEREWKRGDVVTLSLPMEVTTSQWYDGATVVERGPLVYALKMDETWTRRSFEGAQSEKYGSYYYECTSETPWNYGFSKRDMAFEVTEKGWDGAYPWNLEHAPVSIRAKAIRLKDWKEYNGSVGPIAYYTHDGDDTDGTVWIELVPYGCTTLRICEFPTRR